jgi:hypothetical protein
VSWKKLIEEQGPQAALPRLRLELPRPATSTVGLATLAGVVGNSQDPGKIGPLTRRFAPAVGLDTSGQLTRGRDTFDARAATEQWVWQQASDEPTAPFVASTPAEPIPPMDYPFVAVQRTEAEGAAPDAAIDVLRQALTARPARDLLGKHGFRTPDGAPLPTLSSERNIGSVDMPAARPAPDVQRVKQLLTAWTRADRRGRVLALVDISGSMGEMVPGTRNTKLQLALASAGQALGSFDDDTEVGIWAFSTDMGGGRDYQPLIPVGAVGARSALGGNVRDAIRSTLPAVQPKPGGSTGLFDSTLAAYRAMKASYDPRRLNTVVVLTDGRDQDPRGIGAAGFFAALQREVDPKRPVRLITIAYGADADVATLKRMAQVTGGGLHVSRDPRDIDRVIWLALTAL